MARQNNFIESLIKVGYVSTNSYINTIHRLIPYSSDAIKAAYEIEIDDAHELELTDTLERMKRNALALKHLLSLAEDTACNLKTEINAFYDAIEKKKEAERKAKEDAIKAELNRQRARDNYRKKKEAAIQEPDE